MAVITFHKTLKKLANLSVTVVFSAEFFPSRLHHGSLWKQKVSLGSKSSCTHLWTTGP